MTWLVTCRNCGNQVVWHCDTPEKAANTAANHHTNFLCDHIDIEEIQ